MWQGEKDMWASAKWQKLSQYQHLSLFITHLASHNIAQGTIKVYLSAIRYMHVCKGLHNHFKHQMTPWLQLILR